MCDIESGENGSSAEAWGEFANVLISMAGMYASHLYHKSELKKAEELHHEQLKLSQAQHDAEIAQNYGLHVEGVDFDRVSDSSKRLVIYTESPNLLVGCCVCMQCRGYICISWG